jgi:hypothetical protein
VSSSPGTAADPLPAAEEDALPAAPEDDAPLAGADDAPPLAGADDAPPLAGADDAADEVVAGAEFELEAAGVLLPPHAVMTNANAPIPAMVAIALLADVRDTRPTSVSWEDNDVRALTTRAMKAFSTTVGKPEPVILQ